MQPSACRPTASGAPVARLQRDAEALHEALSDLVRVYQFRDRTSVSCHGVSVTQCYALESLVRRGGLTLNELAASLWLDKSTASRVVDALEADGLVRRRRHPADGRSVLVETTAAGRKLHDRIVADLVEQEKALLAGFGPRERRAAVEILAGLARLAACRSRGATSCASAAT